MVTTWWSPQLNALLGSLVVAAGAWLAWGSFSPWGVVLVAGGAAGFLIWQGRTIGLVWAWATLLLGLESLAWPIVTMVQFRSITTEPTDEQLGTMLSAVLTGLISAVFWITFSYGFFKRARQSSTVSSVDATDNHPPTS
jgi:protein-S-isoprenylcysteine O-methyltransferase Ste14